MSKNQIIQNKLPPYSKEIEEAVLGAMMLETHSVALGISKLFEDIFYIESNKVVFRAIRSLYDRNLPPDMLNVMREVSKSPGENWAHYISTITKHVVSSANIESHIAVLQEDYLGRETIRICGQAFADGFNKVTDVWENLQSVEIGLEKAQEAVLGGQQKDIAYYCGKMMDSHVQAKTTGIIGIKTGLRSLDEKISGLVAPDLIVIAARPGQGKTALALSITYNTSVLNQIPCAWFSLEMDGEQLVRRLASIDTGIFHEKLRNGHTDEHESKQFYKSSQKISSCPIYIEDKVSINIRDIKTRAYLLKRKHGIGYIVVDYLQLMKGVDEKNKSRENIVSEISRELKCLAKELGIPVIALSQLSREVEKRADKMPQLSDLRESGSIEQDADEVMFIMRPEYYKFTEPVNIGGTEYAVSGLAIISTEKNRHGSTGYVALNFSGPTMKFSDYNSFIPVNEREWF